MFIQSICSFVRARRASGSKYSCSMSHPDRLPVVAITYAADELDEFIHWRLMFEGLVHAGIVPLAIDCSAPSAAVSEIVQMADGLIISGGVDVDPALYGGNASDPALGQINRDRDSNEAAAFHSALSIGLPVLAICRGAQLTTALLGGQLHIDIPRDAPGPLNHAPGEEALDRAAHPVTVSAPSLLAKLLERSGEIAVNSEHHQAISVIAPGVEVTALAPDGTIEAFEDPARRLVAVQWHPEVLWATETHASALLRNFGEWCTRVKMER